MWLGCQALSYLLIRISTVANATSQDKKKFVKGKPPLLRAATQGWYICGWINLLFREWHLQMLDNGIKPTLDDYHEQPGVQILFFLPNLLDHPEKMRGKKKARKYLLCVWLKYIVSLDIHRNHSWEERTGCHYFSSIGEKRGLVWLSGLARPSVGKRQNQA